jgi:hypothetical protein
MKFFFTFPCGFFRRHCLLVVLFAARSIQHHKWTHSEGWSEGANKPLEEWLPAGLPVLQQTGEVPDRGARGSLPLPTSQLNLKNFFWHHTGSF